MPTILSIAILIEKICVFFVKLQGKVNVNKIKNSLFDVQKIRNNFREEECGRRKACSNEPNKFFSMTFVFRCINDSISLTR